MLYRESVFPRHVRWVMKIPKVSIIIPVFNGSDFLREAIDSALAQTYQSTEVVVINDGSNDGGATERIALSFGKRIRYFKKANGGVASALNLAIEEMSGEYFSWLSHDDLYCREKVAKEVSALEELNVPEAVIYSDYSVFSKDPDDDHPVRLQGVSANDFRFWLTVENRLHGCTLLIPRSAFATVGGFREDLQTTQDYDLWFRMAKSIPFVHIPELLVKARSHENQGSLRLASKALSECNALLSGFVRELEPRELTSATGRSLAQSYRVVASSLTSRGFFEAGQVASRFADEHSSPLQRLTYCYLDPLSAWLYRAALRVYRTLPRSVKAGLKRFTLDRSRLRD